MSRPRVLSLVIALVSCCLATAAVAQVRPMLPPPVDTVAPIIWLTSPWGDVQDSMPYIEFEFCDRYSLNASSRWMRLNGQTVTGSFSYAYGEGGECEWSANAVSATSSLKLNLGQNTLQAHICDYSYNNNCTTETWYITYTARGKAIVALHNLNSDNQDRGLCLTLGAGQAAGLSCGDLFVTHSLPAYRTMGRDRSLTLFYSSGLADPRPLVAAWVSQGATTATPTSVYAQLSVGGVVRASASFYPWNSAAGTRQVALSFDAAAAGFGPGIYAYSLLVRNQYAGGVNDTTLTGELLVASRAGSEFGSGWWIDGLEQLVLSQGSNRILWLGGDGSAAVYDSIAAATWVRAAGPFRDTLSRAAGVFTRALRHRVQVKYDATGHHTQTIDRAGRVTQFAWDSVSGHLRLVSVTVPKVSGSAQTYTFGYQGASALLAYIQDPAGRRISPSVATNTSYGSTITYIDDADNGRTSFAYDSLGRMTGRTNRRNYRTAFSYANNLHVSRVAVPLNPAVSDSARDSSRTRIAWWDEKGLAVGQVGGTLSAAGTDTVYTRSSARASTLRTTRGSGWTAGGRQHRSLAR
jgi:YD repeat-containing protein